MKSWFNKKNKSKFASEKKNKLNKNSVSNDTEFFNGEVEVIDIDTFERVEKSLYDNRKRLYINRRAKAVDVEYVEISSNFVNGYSVQICKDCAYVVRKQKNNRRTIHCEKTGQNILYIVSCPLRYTQEDIDWVNEKSREDSRRGRPLSAPVR